MKINYKFILLVIFLIFKEGLINTYSFAFADVKNKNLKSDNVIAVINGKSLTIEELDMWAKIFNPNQELDVESNRLQNLQFLVNLQAFSQAALTEKIDKSIDFKNRLEFMKQSILQQMYVDNKIMQPISETEMKNCYQKEISILKKEHEIHAFHILLKTEKEAINIINLLNQGKDIKKIFYGTSNNKSYKRGGDLGYFSKGEMVKSFDEAAFSLKKGSYTKIPVKTPFGWHVIKILDIREKTPPSFEESKIYIQNIIFNNRYKKLRKKALDGLKVTYPDRNVSKYMDEFFSEKENSDNNEEDYN